VGRIPRFFAASLCATALLGLPVAHATTPVSAPCSETTKSVLPAPPPYEFQIQALVKQRRVLARGAVIRKFVGPCSGFTSGQVTLVIRRPDGSTLKRSKSFGDLMFKNGYLDKGRPFWYTLAVPYAGGVPQGTCIKAIAQWKPWRYSDGQLVSWDEPSRVRSGGCTKPAS
jgi:hypothetical protein